MPRIKTRKAIEESMRQVHRIKKTSQEETTPESSATQKLESSVKYTAYDTSRFLGHKAKQHIHNIRKKPKIEKAKQSAKTAKRTVQVSKAIGKASITIAKATAKAVAVTGKAIVSAIASGGWIVIILILCFVVFLGAFFYSAEGGDNLQEIALSQVGNIGGEPYWSWYGYETRVEWCGCFVSWCGEQCGYLEEEILPKYASCDNGVSWFQTREQWLEGTDTPNPGMIIFFDWDTEETYGQDGIADHTGIVTGVEDGVITTVEGNSNDSVEMNQYIIGDEEILGYGIPLYIAKMDADP